MVIVIDVLVVILGFNVFGFKKGKSEVLEGLD